MARWGRGRVLGLAGLAVALLAHVAYWYLPRSRAGVPRLERSRELLTEPGWSLVLWLPYPHQNLGALEQRVGDVRAWLALLAESAGYPAPRLPRFGFWSVPPAREWVVAFGPAGELEAQAAVYPTVAALARLAGAVARNPWLGGGEVAISRERRARVDWQGRVWRLTTERSPSPSARAVPELLEALAWVRWEEATASLPAGLWRVRGTPNGGATAELGSVPAPLKSGPRGDAVQVPAAWIAETELGPVGGPTALWIWTEEGVLEGLPRAAVVEADGPRRLPRLPGSSLARWARLEPHRSWVGGARLSAFDASALESAGRLQPWLEASFPQPRGGGGPWRGWAAGADPDRIVGPLERLARHLERLPVLGPPEARRLRGVIGLLAPWQGCGELRVEVWREPTSALLTVCAGG